MIDCFLGDILKLTYPQLRTRWAIGDLPVLLQIVGMQISDQTRLAVSKR